MRSKFNDGQELKLVDLNNIGKAIEKQFYERFSRYYFDLVNIFFSESFKVTRVDATSVNLEKGLALQEDLTAIAPESQIRPIWSDEDEVLAIEAAHATLDRIDIVCIKSDVEDAVTEARKYKPIDSLVLELQDMVVFEDWSYDVQVVAGTPHATPEEPDVPDGYIKIASILVTAATGIAVAGDVSDTRPVAPKPSNSVAHRTVTITDSEQQSDEFVRLDGTGGAFNFSLLSSAVLAEGKRTVFKNVGSANNVTIVAFDDIDGDASVALAPGESITLFNNGTSRDIIG